MDIIEQYFDDFKFGEKWLSDFDGVVYNPDGWEVVNNVKINYITEKLSQKDGEYLIAATLSPRVITIPIFINNNIDIDELYAWLITKEAQWLVLGERRIKAILDNTISFKSYLVSGDFHGECELSFICHDPYFRDEYDNVVGISSNIADISINGNCDSYPLIKITPNGNQAKIRFKLNGDIYILRDVNRDIYINCEKEEVYEVLANNEISVFEKYSSTNYYDFPCLKPYFINRFEIIEGVVTYVKIIINNRYI